MRRLIFVNRFFFPDHSATSQILSDLAFHLAGAGRDIHVVAGAQLYDDPKASLPAQEVINNVRVHRVASTNYGRGGLLGRSIDYLSFYRSAWRCLMEIVRRDDFIVAKTDPPLICAVACRAARRKAAGLINWLQDLYPELAEALGVPFIQGPVGTSLSGLRNRSLRAAVANVVVGRLMADQLRGLGVPEERIHVIPNWCNDRDIQPLTAAENPLRQHWKLGDKFVFGYSGNLGRVHQFETVLAAADSLRNDPHYLFLVIGGGKRFAELQSAVKARGLADSFRFLPYQEQKSLAHSLGVCDAHWVSLNPRLEGLVVPSKFYGIAAAGRPLVFIGAKDGELARLIEGHRCGLVIEPCNGAALVSALRLLSGDGRACADMGARARAMLDANFSRQEALERWRALLEWLEEADCRGSPHVGEGGQQSRQRGGRFAADS
jgi:colanic acid biosynthesis glycosyl transferase WcaI